MDMIGVDEGIKIADAMGITTLSADIDYGLPLVLGAAEVPLIEMTNAYGAFANDGILVKYNTYTEIRDKNGSVIFNDGPPTNQALDPGAAFIISSILSDSKARADSFGGALTISRKAAVKTGTTEDYRDAVTIGYTPQVVVGVWIGNNDNTPMNRVAGSLGSAPIWRQIMEAYLRGKPTEDFKKPSNITDEQVCFEDGQKVEFATTSAYLEYFFRGTQPTTLCRLPTPTPSPRPTSTDVNDRNGDGIPDSKQQGYDQPSIQPKPTDVPQQSPTSTPPQPTNTPISVPTVTPVPSFAPTLPI
jgi:membrane peptidoglycan carboxypeptidase